MKRLVKSSEPALIYREQGKVELLEKLLDLPRMLKHYEEDKKKGRAK